jgi:hypothetical protein
MRLPEDHAVVVDQGTQTSTKDQAKAVGEEAKTSAAAIAGTAKEQAKEVGGQLQEQTRTVVHRATSELEQQLDERLRRLAGSAQERTQQLQALAEGRAEEAGPAADWARTASEQIGRLAGRVEELGPRGVADEVATFARRRPLVFLAGAAAAGFVVGRVVRNAGQASNGASQAGPADDQPVAALPPATVPAPTDDPAVVAAGPTDV